MKYWFFFIYLNQAHSTHCIHHKKFKNYQILIWLTALKFAHTYICAIAHEYYENESY